MYDTSYTRNQTFYDKDPEELKERIKSPQDIKLFGCGEKVKLCVPTHLSDLAEKLGIPEENAAMAVSIISRIREKKSAG